MDDAKLIAQWEARLRAEGMPAEPRLSAMARGSRRQAIKARIALSEATETVTYLPPSKTKQEAARARLEPLLTMLPQKDQTIWRLYHQDGMKQREIARVVGCAQATVSFRLRSAKRKLKYIAKVPPLHQISPEEAARHIHKLIEASHLIHPPHNWKPKVYADVVTHYWRNWDTQATGRELGISQGTIYSRLERMVKHLPDTDPIIRGLQAIRAWKSWTTRHGVLPPDPHMIRNGAAKKMNPTLVRELRQDRANGMSFRDISTKYGIADTTARRIAAGVSWRWVT
jgi:DNA-directed RNA polymerase specialized sigma24 family protein